MKKDYSNYSENQKRVLSMWEYFGLSIIYGLPIIGFIFLIIHSFSDDNLNRRNFARSHWCSFILIAVLMIITIATGVYTAIFSSVLTASL